MRYLKYVAFLAVLMLPLAYSQAQVGVGISVGARPGYYDEPADADSPPVCSYGYYSYYPYACAPYGYYGPQWFAGGVFIGAGPWYHWGWGHGGYYGRAGYYGRGSGYGRGYVRGGYEHGYARGGFAGRGEYHGGGEVRGGSGYHGGGGFHGGGGSHGGGHR